MIRNKLGVRNYEQMRQIEKDIVSTKIKLLDDRITFNMNELNLEFLVRIHKFLFGDLYYDDYTEPRKLTSDELKKINNIFEVLVEIGVSMENLNLLTDLFITLWDMQIFSDGNTRTLCAFLKIYMAYYQLPLEYSINSEIKSSDKVFKIGCQQKIVDNI